MEEIINFVVSGDDMYGWINLVERYFKLKDMF